MRYRGAAAAALALFLATDAGVRASSALAPRDSTPGAARPSIAAAGETFERFASSFVENRGQAHPSVLFYGGGSGSQVSFTKRGIVIAARRQADGDSRPAAAARVALEFVG